MHGLSISESLSVMYQCLFEMTFDKERAKVRRLLRLERVQFLTFASENPEMDLQVLRNRFKLTNLSQHIQVVKGDCQGRLLNQDRILSGWAPQIELTPDTKGVYRLELFDTYPYLFHGRDAKRDATKTFTPYKTALKSHGFNAYLCRDEDDLQLWSNCLPWMFDVVLRLMTPVEFRKENDGCDAMSAC